MYVYRVYIAYSSSSKRQRHAGRKVGGRIMLSALKALFIQHAGLRIIGNQAPVREVGGPECMERPQQHEPKARCGPPPGGGGASPGGSPEGPPRVPGGVPREAFRGALRGPSAAAALIRPTGGKFGRNCVSILKSAFYRPISPSINDRRAKAGLLECHACDVQATLTQPQTTIKIRGFPLRSCCSVLLTSGENSEWSELVEAAGAQ